ncbi:MAG: B12-binding domain-containing radical SAM protein [Pseudothermotoga sp.]|nr:B12-binding domain-containing radical SAM protein [Pseudothermotoga sp.]
MRRPRNARDVRELGKIDLLRSSEKHIEEINLKGDLTVALIFPNNYEIAVSNLGFNLVWKYLNQLEHVRCERFFFDETFERFYSLDTRTPIDQFRIWAFTFHFENDLTNILKLLLKKSVPLRNVDRSESHPVLLFGGSLCYIDLPVLKPLADVVLHGDIEPMLEDLNRSIYPTTRAELIEMFSKFPFSTVPILGKRFERIALCQDLDRFPPISPLIPKHSEFADKLLVEIERGCVHRCSYCMMGRVKKPARFLSLKTIEKTVEKNRSIGLIASNVTDYPWLDELIDLLEQRRVSVSVSSLRIDRLSEKFLKFLRKHQRSLTVAIESASERIRNMLKKNLTDSQIEKALSSAKDVGFEELKMYFMFGFDEETEDDLKAIGDFVRRTLKFGFKSIKLSINPFVPKRGTELENRRMQDEKTLREKMRIISSYLPKHIKAQFESLRECKFQYMVNNLEEDLANEILERIQNTKLLDETLSDLIEAV